MVHLAGYVAFEVSLHHINRSGSDVEGDMLSGPLAGSLQEVLFGGENGLGGVPLGARIRNTGAPLNRRSTAGSSTSSGASIRIDRAGPHAIADQGDHPVAIGEG